LSERVATSVLDLLATALCAEQPTRVCTETMGNAKRLRIQHYVENHLADAERGEHAIAAAVGVTPRYVHRLFEETGDARQ
jgi:AraC-like DNA-binding protein